MNRPSYLYLIIRNLSLPLNIPNQIKKAFFFKYRKVGTQPDLDYPTPAELGWGVVGVVGGVLRVGVGGFYF